MERVKRFELSTSTLARLHSTPELHPLTTSTEYLGKEVADYKTSLPLGKCFYL